EYHVLGSENYYDSDFLECRKFYELAIARSKESSLPKQSELWRSLASTYVLADPRLRDDEEAAKAYQMSVDLLNNRTDYYSNYTRSYSYRAWACGEMTLLNYFKASDLLIKAQAEWDKIPVSVGFDMGYELRSIANVWRTLGEYAFFNNDSQPKPTIELGRQSFQQALELLQSITDKYGISNNYLVDAKAMVYQSWGINERRIGLEEEGLSLLYKARSLYVSLADTYLWKPMRLQGIAELPAPITPSSPISIENPSSLSADSSSIAVAPISPTTVSSTVSPFSALLSSASPLELTSPLSSVVPLSLTQPTVSDTSTELAKTAETSKITADQVSSDSPC
ncbi:MAG: hypothetical protein AAFZ17_10175, partial [Cyanobacteria bacterium J06650_10]